MFFWGGVCDAVSAPYNIDGIAMGIFDDASISPRWEGYQCFFDILTVWNEPCGLCHLLCYVRLYNEANALYKV